MTARLRLLDEVSYDGRPVTGERSQALLATLAAARGSAVSEAALIEALWGDGDRTDRPAQPAKALQVVVSRTRTQTGGEVVVRAEPGYRLGLAADDVDVAQLAGCAQAAVQAERDGDQAAAVAAARAGLALPATSDGGSGPLADLRVTAGEHRDALGAVLGRALSAAGDHAEALPLLLDAASGRRPDEATLAAVLRSEAAVHGAPAALRHYETHRRRLGEQLGVDPGPVLQAVHAELLAADRPVREGLRHDATSLVGRDDDLRALRALVARSRVTSIVGPGGLGKTRLAHLLGREATEPVVHLVELVGVTAPDDVVGEVGSALGVRDSVSGRRVLTPEQRRDVRARIAQQCDAAPTLLILDNCEHVVGAVADLVAFLVTAAPRLRVVTTTRAPLAIAAERVFALDHLDDDQAVELFDQRALAARPGARLDAGVVRRVVRRLDGLPLAIELAAAKVRVMSVSDIDRRLDDRFALLRGQDLGAPDRHRTLLAVIDWSWQLLAPAEQAALTRLALFQDGFDLDAAEAVAGPGALAAVEALAGQSLLAVQEEPDGHDGGVRYRMLETVREFARLHLDDHGGEVTARRALRDWAVDWCAARLSHLEGPRQLEVVSAVGTEDTNLTDVLRTALAAEGPASDREAVVVLLALLAGVWTIRGEHARVVSLSGAVEGALAGWDPPPALVRQAARAAAMVSINSALAELPRTPVCRALLAAAPPDAVDPGTRALQRVFGVVDDLEMDGWVAALEELAGDPDRAVARMALQWSCHWRENSGDIDGAIEAGERSLRLWRSEDGVWSRAQVQTQLTGLLAQVGRLTEAARLADEALVDLDLLQAHDDATQLRSVLATAAIVEGRLDDADRLVAEMAASPDALGSRIALGATRAELAIARGDIEAGLAAYDDVAAVAATLRFPMADVTPGLEPWVLYTRSAALAAHARCGPGPGASVVLDALTASLPALLAAEQARIDFPVAGAALFALGLWDLCTDGPADRAVHLVALADRFGYSRMTPSLAWDRAVAKCERRAPGALAAALASYGDRRGVEVLADASMLVG